jgi:hypothetical protein
VIAYYESDGAPPGAMLVDLARALGITADELLGMAPVREKISPKTARLLKRLRRIEELPPADQRAVLTLQDTGFSFSPSGVDSRCACHHSIKLRIMSGRLLGPPRALKTFDSTWQRYQLFGALLTSSS